MAFFVFVIKYKEKYIILFINAELVSGSDRGSESLTTVDAKEFLVLVNQCEPEFS